MEGLCGVDVGVPLAAAEEAVHVEDVFAVLVVGCEGGECGGGGNYGYRGGGLQPCGQGCGEAMVRGCLFGAVFLAAVWGGGAFLCDVEYCFYGGGGEDCGGEEEVEIRYAEAGESGSDGEDGQAGGEGGGHFEEEYGGSDEPGESQGDGDLKDGGEPLAAEEFGEGCEDGEEEACGGGDPIE